MGYSGVWPLETICPKTNDAIEGPTAKPMYRIPMKRENNLALQKVNNKREENANVHTWSHLEWYLTDMHSHWPVGWAKSRIGLQLLVKV
jgi:hypothetical protein